MTTAPPRLVSPSTAPQTGDILIRGARVINPAAGHDGAADVLIRDGVVSAIGPGLEAPKGAEVIDATGMLVTPGWIDPHVHLREPGQEHKETIATGTRAAAAGGFTAVVCMPNTAPALDTPERVGWITERAEATASVRVFPIGCGTLGREGDTPTDAAALQRAGAVGISDDGDAVADPGVMRAVFERTHSAGLVFMQHCQDPAMTQGSVMHQGDVSMRLGLTGWPREAEERIVERDIAMVRETGCAYHVQHISSAGSVELVRRARAEGLPVSAEASPHHLMLTDEACAGFETFAKMNPPLREAHDREAIRAGVADGTITVLATDHAPHTNDEKDAPFESAPFGIVGLEIAVPLYAEALVATGLIDWPRLIAGVTTAPAALCGLDGLGLGRLEVGGPADVTVYDPEARWTCTEDSFAGKQHNSPFLGHAMTGRVVATVCAGRVVYRSDAAMPA